MKNENIDREDLVLIIDGLNLFTRHFVAHPALGVNGQHVGGIVGFLYAMIKFAEDFKPTKLVVVWEGGGSKRKRDIYPDYKQKRRPAKLNRAYDNDLPDTVQNRNHQVETLVKILSNTPVIQMYVPDCEADDVIGYITKYKFKDDRKLIVSSDKDFYQLLGHKTIIYSPTWKKLVTHKEVVEKFNISPENFCLAKSVCGDPADNIPGVKGVGFKTLAKRFPAFRSTESINVSDLVEMSEIMVSEGTKIKSIHSIIESRDLILRNWRLIYLDTGNLAPIQIKSIHEIIDTFSPRSNKIMTMKSLISEGIQTFNVDRLFLSLIQLR